MVALGISKELHLGGRWKIKIDETMEVPEKNRGEGANARIIVKCNMKCKSAIAIEEPSTLSWATYYRSMNERGQQNLIWGRRRDVGQFAMRHQESAWPSARPDG